MDTIKILLSLTVALLLGALAMSWKGFRQEQMETPKSELAEVQRQIDQIRIERERLKLERERLLLGEVAVRGPATQPPSPTPASGPAVPPMEVIPETFAGASPAVLSPPPAGPPPPAIPTGDERAEKIVSAAVVAKITEWVDNPELGAFATIEVKDPALKADVVVCIRRNSGILGRLKVAEVTPDGGIANAMGPFPGLKPVEGDELILEP